MGDDRANTYVEDGMVIYRASSTGNCIRGLVASRLGHTPEPFPSWLLEKFAEGVTAEPLILKMLEAHDNGKYVMLNPSDLGMKVDAQGQVEVEIGVGSKVRIRCHPDGIATDAEELWVVEAKALGKSYWDKYEKKGITAFPYYSTQLALEMAGTNLPALFVVGRKNEAGIVTEIRVDEFREPPVPLAGIKARIIRAERMVANGGTVLPECDTSDYPCAFYYLHEDEQGYVDESVEVDEELDRLALAYDAGKRAEKAGKGQKEEASAAIVKLMMGKGKDEVRTRAWEIGITRRTTTRTDMAMVEKLMRDDDLQTCQTHGVSTFPTVKPRV